jgi:hypothetical protein
MRVYPLNHLEIETEFLTQYFWKIGPHQLREAVPVEQPAVLFQLHQPVGLSGYQAANQNLTLSWEDKLEPIVLS